ncbi:MAG: isoamylase early set domain-containing protein [Balneolales bacterium]|nr:isoamylase early set domain-containing protein [Balneolales bacterium]
MITKEFTPKRTICKVLVQIPQDWADQEAAIVGDFNSWDPTANKLERKNGNWETVLRLKPESEIRFRYLLDGSRWANDESADAFEDNEHGEQDCVLTVGK